MIKPAQERVIRGKRKEQKRIGDKREDINRTRAESRWMMDGTFHEGGYSVRGGNLSADSSKDQLADTVSGTPVHFDPDQVGLPPEPVDAANTALPTPHHRAALLVRSRNLSLRLAPATECFPLLWGNTSHKCRVKGIEHIQICNYCPRGRGARVGALDLLV